MVSTFVLLSMILTTAFCFIEEDPLCRDKVKYPRLNRKIRTGKRLVAQYYKGPTRTKLTKTLDDLQLKVAALGKDTNIKTTSIDMESKFDQMLSAVNRALPKFKSGNPFQTLSGIGDILVGLGMLGGGTYGVIFATFGGLLSNVFGLFGGTNMKVILEKIVRDVVREENDKKVLDALNGIKAKYHESKVKLDSHRGKESKMDVETLNQLIDKVEDTKTFELGKIEGKIQRPVDTMKEAERRIQIISMYCRVILLRNLILIDLSLLVERTKKRPAKVGEINSMRLSYFQFYKETLAFLRSQSDDNPDNYLTLSAYYPIEKSITTKSIDAVLGYIGLEKQEFVLSSSIYYVLTPEKYPNWYIGSDRDGVKAVKGMSKAKKIQFHNAGNGYYYLYIRDYDGYGGIAKMTMLFKEIGADQRLTHEFKKDRKRGEEYLQFSIIPKNAAADKFLIANKGCPGQFVFMGSDNSIRIYAKDPTKQGYWSIAAT